MSLLIVLCLVAILVPLIASIITGILGKIIGRVCSHTLTIGGVLIAFLASLWAFLEITQGGLSTLNVTLYHWGQVGNFDFTIGILYDRLSGAMMLLVTFVSFLVHLYSVGYMREDAGYQRFFSYMSLFTFAMLMLVLANNFLTLFFGWEGVGLVSYLLIGFWHTKETAAFGGLKAFIVNRVGDMGMILGIAGVFAYLGSLDYHYVFTHTDVLSHQTITLFVGHPWSAVSVIAILLLIGAMGKSAQMPLHVWLPESMEGPTPISAMIHAATMVTAGVYLLVRLSPIIELSQVTLTLILVLGATTCLFMGLLGVFQNDIKRVIAYSTLSQLGYMMAAVGASAFQASMFHLFTHGCFKALLFLAAGSVIIGMHHEQDMRKMGNLYRYMPLTYVAFLVGALALCAIPPFAGFFSKDTIIDAVWLSHIPGAMYAYICVIAGTFVTALYTFRAFFLTFHGKENIPADIQAHVQESSWVMTVPLVLLSIASIVVGFIFMKPLLYGYLLGNTITISPAYPVWQTMAMDFKGTWHFFWAGFTGLAFWLAIVGIVVAWYFTLVRPSAAAYLKQRLYFLYWICVNKYGFDDFNQIVLVRGTQKISAWLVRVIDLGLIDRILVNGMGPLFRHLSSLGRKLQTGRLYHYVFFMMIGLFILLGWRLLL